MNNLARSQRVGIKRAIDLKGYMPEGTRNPQPRELFYG
jgi:hypothetical protein